MHHHLQQVYPKTSTNFSLNQHGRRSCKPDCCGSKPVHLFLECKIGTNQLED
uniref:Uncharacterized protein n=1 Tax=Arundo donax TaxID=35708 RepID=A0A0A8ZMC9_ARUDO